MDQLKIEKEIHVLIMEIRFEADIVRKAKMLGAKKALEWVLDSKRHFEPHMS